MERVHAGEWVHEQPDRAAATKGMLTALHGQLLTCVEMLADFQPPSAPALDLESALYLAANFDAMYHVLLDYHLSSDWPSPSVPPPHAYLPELARSVRAQRIAAARTLLDAAPPPVADAFCATWDVERDSLELAADADPLRQVRLRAILLQ